jgi:hypothetical protein
MLRLMALVRTNVWEGRSASIIRVTRIGELGTMLAVTNNRRTLRRATRRNIPEDDILLKIPQFDNTLLAKVSQGHGEDGTWSA